MFRLVAVSFAIAVVLCPNVAVRADEISGTIEARAAVARRAAAVETILSDWLKAARDCKSYDAKFTRWDYEPVFGDRTKPANVAQGRILFQRGGPSRYDIPNDECWLWQGNEISEIDWHTKTHRLHEPLDPNDLQKERTETPLPDFFGLHDAIARSLTLWYAELGIVPGLLATDHKQFRSHYEIRITERSPDKITLTAQLKSGSRSGRILHDRLDYAFSDGNALPYAVRFTVGSRSTVYQFHDPLINKPAPDAETFLKPDLGGLERIDLREPPAKSK